MSNTNRRIFHLTLGPVQSFVSQARRTRDFWAGSFLLSYLTAHAMKATQAQYGQIMMPDISSDELLIRIEARQGEGPNIASLPNVFEAEVSDTFDGKKVADAIQAEWLHIAEEVWDHDRLATLKVDKELWDEQITNFWEIVWVLTDTNTDTNTPALSMRKNWRSLYPPEQLGDKCTMMGEWQELSGVDRPGGEIQSVFWDTVRKIAPDIRQGERLCAISYVKRRFVHHWEKVHAGWELPTGVPSTSYLAAVHWIKQVLLFGNPEEITAFTTAAKKISQLGEWKTSIACIEKLPGGKHFSSLDGPIFFRSALENRREYEDEAKAALVLSALGKLAETKLPSGRKIGHPSPFYAILLMDGDRLGETKKALGGDAKRLSKALGEFTRAVPKIVRHNNGFLVYAGGDDVLALLPLEDALNCALALRTAYLAVFAKQEIARDKYSISAAINFAHMKLPLTLILKDVHRLLDEIAKEATGRDAIAVRVWKPGGAQLTWSMKWQSDGCNNIDALNSLVTEFQSAEAGEAGHASKPLFRICERLEMLQGGAGFEENDIKKLLIAEYVTSGVLSKEELKQEIAKQRIEQLMPLAKTAADTYGTDAVLLLRFLAQKGVES